MTRKDRTEGIYSRREVLDESERRQYCLIQLKDLLSYAYRYSEDVKKRFDRAQFNVEKFKTLSDIKHIPILKKKELIFLQSMGPRLGGLLTKDIGDLKRIFLSPGPIFDPEDRGEDYWGYTEAFYSVGFRPGDAVQNTFNYQLTPAGLMFEGSWPFPSGWRAMPWGGPVWRSLCRTSSASTASSPCSTAARAPCTSTAAAIPMPSCSTGSRPWAWKRRRAPLVRQRRMHLKTTSNILI